MSVKGDIGVIGLSRNGAKPYFKYEYHGFKSRGI